MSALFEDPASPKVSLLVGHDSNIGSVLVALGITDYSLPGQYEKTPIGGCCSSSAGVIVGPVKCVTGWCMSIPRASSYVVRSR